MQNPIVVTINDREIECYGDLEETSNFHVICEDEENDAMWFDGNPETGLHFVSWEEAARIIAKEHPDVVEIDAC